MTYLPIAAHGVIGDLHTAALVGADGTIDWCCWPRFDSPSVFGSVLDARQGGSYRIAPAGAAGGAPVDQAYLPGTNVLVTRFRGRAGDGRVTDFMPLASVHNGSGPHQRLVRRVTAERGSTAWKLECRPAFDYARATAKARPLAGAVRFDGPDLSLVLRSRVPLQLAGGGATAQFTLGEGETASFVLEEAPAGGGSPAPLSEARAAELLERTAASWRGWLAGCGYRGRWRGTVERSALVLKLLTHRASGAVVAAPTTSLPELVGGERNWDYRYAWIRDAAFTFSALLELGFSAEAAAFLGWIEERCRESRPGGTPDAADIPPLGVLYRVDGRPGPEEEVLEHLAGYRDSRPVRIGNGAARQLQLDVYGELLETAWRAVERGVEIEPGLWSELRRLVDWVTANWRHEDEGIWEVRSGRQQFVHSKLMCWVGLDRGLRLAARRGDGDGLEPWRSARRSLRRQLLARGWSSRRKAFVQAYGSEALDAAVLALPLTGFLPVDDPRVLATLETLRRPVDAGGLMAGGLLRRYDPRQASDGLAGGEGSFGLCSCWLVEALAMAGAARPELLADAQRLFERLLACASPLGLYAEEIGPGGEALGNFPQAFTHLGLVGAALALDRALDRARAG